MEQISLVVQQEEKQSLLSRLGVICPVWAQVMKEQDGLVFIDTSKYDKLAAGAYATTMQVVKWWGFTSPRGRRNMQMVKNCIAGEAHGWNGNYSNRFGPRFCVHCTDLGDYMHQSHLRANNTDFSWYLDKFVEHFEGMHR